MVSRPHALGQSDIMVGGCGEIVLHILPDRKNWQEIQEGTRARHSPKCNLHWHTSSKGSIAYPALPSNMPSQYESVKGSIH